MSSTVFLRFGLLHNHRNHDIDHNDDFDPIEWLCYFIARGFASSSMIMNLRGSVTYQQLI